MSSHRVVVREPATRPVEHRRQTMSLPPRG